MPAAATAKSTSPTSPSSPLPLPGLLLRRPPRSPGLLPRAREPVALPGLRPPDPTRAVPEPAEPHDVGLPDAAARPGGCRGAGAPVEDAPALERLLAHGINWGPWINVVHAPRLQMLSYLGVGIPELQLGSTLFRLMRAVRLSAEFRCVRTLALEMAEPQVKPVADFLRCFPCLEMLYVTSHMVVPQSMEILNYEMDNHTV
ncbi:hypothetical protein GQ55_2G103900 [Panicum hallii var. hallii]|uniref:F-box/LRR-repeat protein 15/At3g58940/PEG3-like LRR domain-containing protein n=1 Tax=Panicum hallii var. hallii TaxID=1504633 RepID=A0A2T7ENI5_9POAL|nr:hypothetical protein GQ55_2G103900 [Panicum hallii var. hallii]